MWVKRMDSLGWRLPLMCGALLFAALYGRFHPAPPPPPKATATVSISVGPPAAQIFVDGKPIEGAGPVALAPSRRVLLLRHDGSRYVVVPHAPELVTVELVRTH